MTEDNNKTTKKQNSTLHVKVGNEQYVPSEAQVEQYAKLFANADKTNNKDKHQSLPVLGYVPQSNEKIDLVNENKQLEEHCLRRIEWFLAENEKFKDEQKILICSPEQYPYSKHDLEQAYNHIMQAFMWLNRAIFKPKRISLPEDKSI